jgi:hypothetical protein
MRVITLDDVKIHDKPCGFVEYEGFWKLPILGKLDRCERTAAGWFGYAGDIKFDATENFKHTDKPDHVVVADKAGRLIGAVVLNWKRQRKPKLKAAA